ncbi:MAG: hydrogenase expression/formation protein [Acidobacteria bacterium]|nr:hydrogenase expression/formation protein [Acidobacteriota bacterium]MBI3427194.1 hydrogenase expression/formation protein [Acidobacteriota bacterium]
MELMNAIPLLTEIKHALAALRERGETRTLNILNFPLTDDDARYLDEVLGRGNLTITFDGAEHTFWQESNVAGVWWGEYRNASRKITLRSIEIAEVPPLVRAQTEDIDDGLQHLAAALATPPQNAKRALPVLGMAAD